MGAGRATGYVQGRGAPHQSPSHVDLKGQARLPNAWEASPGAGIRPRPDRLDPDRVGVEHDGVRLHRNRADRPDVAADGLERAITLAQQIQIARGAVGLIRPEAKEHRALEHETLPGFGLPEAVQKALEAEACEEGLVDVARLLRLVKQSRGNGGRNVALASGHAIASR